VPRLDPNHHGLEETWIVAVLTILVLHGPCWLHRRYKQAHPDGRARYI
jgi:hypothetical protein